MTAPGRPVRRDAHALRDLVLDPGSWTSWDAPLQQAPADLGYADELADAAARSGQDEAVITGEGRLRGRRVAVVAGEFGFLAGSIGVAAAERLIAAVEGATGEGLPLLAGLPYLVYLRNPTFGGVLASWGSLGHVTIAEPGAAIGFLGPRVYEALYGEPFPEGVQTAEHLAERGIVDAVVPHEEVADLADRALRVLAARQTWHTDVRGAERPAPEDGTDADDPEDHRSAWDVVTASRREDRPGVRRLLRTAATDVVGLSGTGAGEKDPGLLLALARFGGAPCVVLGQGTGGGALALVPADRVLAAANGWLGPLPPEGASAIVHRTTERADEMAAAQGVRATDLWRAGIVDRVVPERPDAADEPQEFCRRLGRVLGEELAGLLGRDDMERYRSRLHRYRHLGR